MKEVYNCCKMVPRGYTLITCSPKFDELKIGSSLSIVLPLKDAEVISKTDKFVSIAYKNNGNFELVIYKRGKNRLPDSNYDELIVKKDSLLEKRINKIFNKN